MPVWKFQRDINSNPSDLVISQSPLCRAWPRACFIDRNGGCVTQKTILQSRSKVALLLLQSPRLWFKAIGLTIYELLCNDKDLWYFLNTTEPASQPLCSYKLIPELLCSIWSMIGFLLEIISSASKPALKHTAASEILLPGPKTDY